MKQSPTQDVESSTESSNTNHVRPLEQQRSTVSNHVEENAGPGAISVSWSSRSPSSGKKDLSLSLNSISAHSDQVVAESLIVTRPGIISTEFSNHACHIVKKQDRLQLSLPSPMPVDVDDSNVPKKNIGIQAIPGSSVPPVSTHNAPTTPVSSGGRPVNEEGSVPCQHPTTSLPLEPDPAIDASSLQLVAELVPDTEEMAARVAQQLEEQMDSQWEQRLQQVVQSKVMGASSSPLSAPRPVVEATLVQLPNTPDKSTTENEARSPLFWVLIAIIVVVFGGVIVVVAVLAGGNRDKDSAPTHTPSELNTAGTASPSTFPSNPRREYLLEALGPIGARNNSTDAWALWNDPLSPQAQALKWMSEEDEWWAIPSESLLDTSALLERYALAVLYFSTSGLEWSENVFFLHVNTSVCDWNNGGEVLSDRRAKGVFCSDNPDGSSHQIVTQIFLNNLRLTGNLPWEISLLTALTTMEMVDNALKGPLPSVMPSSLQDLLVTNNFLSGNLATDWADTMPNLTKALLGDNRFYGSIPSEMGDLSSLERFIIQANDVNGTIPSDLGRLKRLERLDLSWNSLHGILPTELGNLQSLNQLYFVGNPALSGSVPSEFGNLRELAILYLQDTSLTGSVDSTLCFLNNTSLSITADCLGEDPELDCSCCVRCCTTKGEDCETSSGA